MASVTWMWDQTEILLGFADVRIVILVLHSKIRREKNAAVSFCFRASDDGKIKLTHRS